MSRSYIEESGADKREKILASLEAQNQSRLFVKFHPIMILLYMDLY